MTLLSGLTDLLPVRRRLGADPLQPMAAADARYAPVPVHRLKVTGNLVQDILARRHQDAPFSMDHGRRLAVVIPFRDRGAHLAVLLPRLQQALDDQRLDYRVIVVEQAPGKLFSRARTINIGADLAGAAADYFCFHDVDMYPEAADYGCPSQPLRLVKRFSTTYRRASEITGYYFSGAIAIRRDQFMAVNGFDGGFWGFGSQDEDFFLRCLLGGLVPHEDRAGVFGELDNPPAEQSYRTTRIRKGNKRRLIWQSWRRQVGRAGMSDLRYRVLDRRDEGRVTRVLVEP
jgi:hypothetical protein